MKRVLHVTDSDGNGGAARAAFRIHQSLASVEARTGVESHMLVRTATREDPRIIPMPPSRGPIRMDQVGRRIVRTERRLLKTQNPIIHSTARIRTSAIQQILRLKPDAVLLHWLGSRVLSIKQVGSLLSSGIPVCWVLHDTWAFCGAEHYPNGHEDRRFADGYHSRNRPEWEAGIDINRMTWVRKHRYWTHPAQIIAPSRWMAEQSGRSALMGSWPTEVIPNPLHTGWWGELSRSEARARLGIPHDRRIVLFGAIGGEKDPRKGADFLRRALPRVVERLSPENGAVLDLLTFGGPPGVESADGVTVRSVGRLDDEGLRLFYSAADVMVVPSRQEAFGQTASEAVTCGTPVVAFNIGGLPDIIEDRKTGRLVEPFDVEGLAAAIVWVLGDLERHARLSDAARRHASRWDHRIIGSRYAELLVDVIGLSP
jgi:glycosyltransferase involved in cell wall biosynthesis